MWVVYHRTTLASWKIVICQTFPASTHRIYESDFHWTVENFFVTQFTHVYQGAWHRFRICICTLILTMISIGKTVEEISWRLEELKKEEHRELWRWRVTIYWIGTKRVQGRIIVKYNCDIHSVSSDLYHNLLRRTSSFICFISHYLKIDTKRSRYKFLPDTAFLCEINRTFLVF